MAEELDLALNNREIKEGLSIGAYTGLYIKKNDFLYHKYGGEIFKRIPINPSEIEEKIFIRYINDMSVYLALDESETKPDLKEGELYIESDKKYYGPYVGYVEDNKLFYRKESLDKANLNKLCIHAIYSDSVECLKVLSKYTDFDFNYSKYDLYLMKYLPYAPNILDLAVYLQRERVIGYLRDKLKLTISLENLLSFLDRCEKFSIKKALDIYFELKQCRLKEKDFYDYMVGKNKNKCRSRGICEMLSMLDTFEMDIRSLLIDSKIVWNKMDLDMLDRCYPRNKK